MGLEKIANLIGRCAIYEALYLKGALQAAKDIEKALTELYAGILMYLARAKLHLTKNTGGNIALLGPPTHPLYPETDEL